MRAALPGALVLSIAAPAYSFAANAHTDPSGDIGLWLAIILLVAKLGGDLATRVGQPAVLGELLVGVVLGNLALVGFSWLEPMKDDAGIELLSRLGVLILLFEVGLESTVKDMLRVGPASLAVALLGVLAPFALGWGVGAWLLPESSTYVHAFLGAMLTATSVGITAQVLKDIGRSRTNEAYVILGAAVIDDVLGLIILAVVSGVITAANHGVPVDLAEIGGVIAKAGVFLLGSLLLGIVFSRRLFLAASRLRSRGVLLASGLAVCFFLSWLASEFGLASLVGAFAAGLILESIHYQPFVNRGEQPLEELVHPISSFLVPVFFVLMGMRMDLRSFSEPGVLALGAGLTVAAILGKQVCSLGVSGKGIHRLTVGIGMVPRGEVGLVFANLGLGLTIAGERIVNEGIYAAVVIMVLVTTMMTPPALKWSMGRTVSG